MPYRRRKASERSTRTCARLNESRKRYGVGVRDADLAPGMARQFFLYSYRDLMRPSHVWVRWDGQAEAVAVAIRG